MCAQAAVCNILALQAAALVLQQHAYRHAWMVVNAHNHQGYHAGHEVRVFLADESSSGNLTVHVYYEHAASNRGIIYKLSC